MKTESLSGVKGAMSITIGIVKKTNDPSQNGRLRVFCPAIDDEDYLIDDLPWAWYCAPFGGTTKNMKNGPNGDTSYGPSAYGFWAIPKVGAQVIVYYLNSDSDYRIWAGCMYPIQMNRSLPGGVGVDDSGAEGPWTDSDEKKEPNFSKLRAAGLSSGPHYLTRGYERQIAQRNDKDGKEGYAKNPSSPDELDPQGYCFTTPAGHFMSMQDSPEFSRVRLRTAGGNQIILDDTNERIYISTSTGKTWIEMDEDGHMHVYASESISYHTKADFNLKADGDINFESGGSINLKSGSVANIDAASDININTASNISATAGGKLSIGGATTHVSSDSILHLLGSGGVNITGALIAMNSAASAEPGQAAGSALPPVIIPTHEPWNRPASKQSRNKYWKA